MRRRWLIKLGLLLVAGAIVNVALAWGLGVRARRAYRDDMVTCRVIAHLLASEGREAPHESLSSGFNRAGVEFHVAAFGGGGEVLTAKSGWPSLSIKATLHEEFWDLSTAEWLMARRKPMWPGFAVNTIFYAAVLWLLFAFPFVLRSRRRLKRGLCPSCAYPIGSNALCTECGKPIRSEPRMNADERR